MPTRRQQRINEMIFEELSLLLPGRLEDPRLLSALVTRVETTQDLATAKIFVTTTGEDDTSADALRALAHAEGLLRSELASLGLRRLPRLVFAQDRAYERGQRVLHIIDSLEDDATGADPTDTDTSDAGPAGAEAIGANTTDVGPAGAEATGAEDTAADARGDGEGPRPEGRADVGAEAPGD